MEEADSFCYKHDTSRRRFYSVRVPRPARPLLGQSPWGFAWTKLAEAYPQGVAEIIALSSAIAALGLARRLDIEKASERSRFKTLNAETAEAAALERRRR